MFLPEVISFFSPIFSLASTIFMIWMIVDCVRNQGIRSKAGWIIFILFTQFIGAAVYFFTHGPWPKVRQDLFSQRSVSGDQTPRAPNPRTPPAPQPMQATFADYAQGYQAQQHDSEPVFQTYVQTPEALPLQPEYEQFLVMYPEAPQGEQHQ